MLGLLLFPPLAPFVNQPQAPPTVSLTAEVVEDIGDLIPTDAVSDDDDGREVDKLDLCGSTRVGITAAVMLLKMDVEVDGRLSLAGVDGAGEGQRLPCRSGRAVDGVTWTLPDFRTP